MRGKHLSYFQSGVKIIQQVNQCFQSSLCRCNIDMRASVGTRGKMRKLEVGMKTISERHDLL